MNINIWNINILGMGFMLIFSAFSAATFLQTIVFKDYNKHGINIDTGFRSLAIIFAVLSVSNFIGPAVIEKLGSRMSLFLSIIPNVIFIYSLYEPYEWSVYLLSALLGVGGGVLWSANGEVIARNSPGDTKPRNTGIFWSWFQMSCILGNTFLYFQLGNADTITDRTRHIIFLVLGSFSAAGMMSFLLLRSPPKVEGATIEGPGQQSLLQPIKDGLKFAVSREMALLYPAFIFTGLSMNFWSSMLIVCVGNVFPKRKYLALTGISVGLGAVASGFLWSALTYKIGRRGVLICATIICLISYTLVFLSFPFDAATTPEARAQDTPIISSNIYLALAAGFLEGLGDGGFNVSIISTLGAVYEANPAPAFAVFKFVQCILTMSAFLYCGTLLLPYQLLILAVTCLLGCAVFLVLDTRQVDNRQVENGQVDHMVEEDVDETLLPIA